MKMSFPEGIDLVIYINLDIRTDRRDEMEAELARVGVPKDKTLRWSATRIVKNGILGCATSHLKALEHIQSLPENIQNVIVVEDDFNFIHDPDRVRNSLREFLTYPKDSWDMILLSYVILEREDYNSLISRCLKSYLASGYLINRQSLPKIIRRFQEACDGLTSTGDWHTYAVDNYWWMIMKDRKTFYFNIPLGYQRKSYSNLDCEVRERYSHVSLKGSGHFHKHHSKLMKLLQ